QSMAFSPMDHKLYVVDSGTGTCGGSCVRQVDPATGAVTTTAIAGLGGPLNGIAFDATGAKMYVLLAVGAGPIQAVVSTYTGAVYPAPTACSNATNAPSQPQRLLVDGTLLYVSDSAFRNLKTVALPCTGAQPFVNLNPVGTYPFNVGITRIPASSLLV